MKPCTRCGAKVAPFGLGTPLVPELEQYCGDCIAFHPTSQQALARTVHAALEET